MSGTGSDNGWMHRQYCKGKDALFTTRQSDFVKHAENARGRASHGQAPAGAVEELALTRQTNLAVVQRLQAKINALEAELDASRKAESQAQSYADDLNRLAQYDADNLADACGGYGGERI